MHASVIYRRAIFDAIGGFDGSLKACEDYDMFFRITRNHRVCRFDRLVAQYRLHDESMSRDAARMLRTALTVLRRQWTYVSGNADYVHAYKVGIRTLRKRYTRQVIRTSYARLRTGSWSRIGRVLPELVSFSTAWLSAVLMEARAVALASVGSVQHRGTLIQLAAKMRRTGRVCASTAEIGTTSETARISLGRP